MLQTMSTRLWLGAFLVTCGACLPQWAAAQTWQDCAQENSICRFTGEAKVRFGAGQQFAYAVGRNRVICDAQEFGDADPGRPKICQVLSTTLLAPSAQVRTPVWRVCAAEGGECQVYGVAEVRFGTDARYNTRSVQQRVVCGPDQFGDPAPGRVKQCEVLDTGGPHGADAAWRPCSPEGAVCHVPGTTRVRFGAAGRYQMRDVVGAIDCSVQAFGDPAPGQAKQCEYNTAPGSAAPAVPPVHSGELRDASGVWDICSDEGGVCHVRGKATVRFGADQRWIARPVTNSVACNTAVFGDPNFGVAKSCYVRR